MAGHEDGLRASRFSANANLSGETIEIEDANLETSDANYAVRERLPSHCPNLNSGLPAQAALALLHQWDLG